LSLIYTLEKRDLDMSDAEGATEERTNESASGRAGFQSGRSHGGFGGQRSFRPAPVRVGEEYSVKIESISKRGDAGVAKIEGLVIFVAGTKVGDNVRIKIVRVGRGYAIAEALDKATNGGGEGLEKQEHTSNTEVETGSISENNDIP
jgi:predicted RNA-binding protein with TRAM domain